MKKAAVIVRGSGFKDVRAKSEASAEIEKLGLVKAISG
jgi:hypothetical protein